ncbi:pilus assembly protein [Bradyrhizobium sp. U87765 SZCCT0131]|uniref:TadE/TadG family type IV pilus assembly protein n=1 Tax=unclassified Bradyrhizobium TaxID=2631580 RepID=UPI001BAAB66A|nr:MULTISPECIES: TadE/TadG family type IV pilus assembly protein [unclassified Bradyrhizobium]MBR1222100.1 pilus assembly protein [Bradyrhizobium sp. U87765 SZCCT0131]MBR1263702.1 pilus assembly protein [Bradyrhizobium sp. U87765 SZCCT0134]MBR1302728.1 pilus assembly protein [Bradyrhizobium sp. U87765 SZCCT0110]MBR1319952.1 pilus assembly protein [Bradyrhizobium sp. U87765 SZCCT0109]MBR1348935.1 pilus assembly protein [Bradyrhizobium sp. U87765 SZCCT0048]
MASPLRFTSIRATLLRFRDSRRASAAVEFALIAPWFLALLFAIIEIALVFFAGQMLETATQDSARLIMTGQAQTATGGGYTQAQFKTQVCNRLAIMFDCQNKLALDVRSYPCFSQVATPQSPIDNTGNLRTDFQFNMGTPASVVVVRVFYPWRLFVTGLGFNVANMTGGQYLLQASAAFRNEPYAQTASSSCSY